MRYEVFKAMNIQIVVFWVVVSYHIVTRRHNPEDDDLTFVDIQNFQPNGTSISLNYCRTGTVKFPSDGLLTQNLVRCISMQNFRLFN
jgi:hypothetical protein